MAHVLLVEDDHALGSALSVTLDGGRHEVRWCVTGAAAIAAAESGTPYDLVLLDLGLPDLDGIDVCRALRARLPDAVVVVLTARDAEIDVVVGLEAGADDYLTKPVRAAELLARLRAHLRRVRSTTAASGVPSHITGALRVDARGRRAWVGNVELALRAKQFDLLTCLATQAGVAVSRETLMAEVWDTNWFGSTKTLDVHVAGLRKALTDAAQAVSEQPPRIVTLRGFGYRLEVPGS